VLLNVGCGEFYAAGWTNTDLHDDLPHGPHPDVVCSILALPFPDGSAERIYCGHVLEHIRLDDMPQALHEVRRVLVHDGTLMVVGPDIRLTLEHEPVLVDGVRFGGRRWPGDEHHWTATGEETLAHLWTAGFDGVLFPVADVSDAWPIVARAPWQFAIHAQPKE